MKMLNGLVIAGWSAALLAGCSGGSGDVAVPQGTLSLSVTDAPVADATEVWVQFSGVELQSSTHGRQFFDFSEQPKRIELLALEGGGSEWLLEEELLPAGKYEWIRLMVDAEPGVSDTYLVTATGEHELTVPSGDQTGLKLNRGFVVPAGGRTDFTIDFDLRKSLVLDAQGYKLRPTLRLIDNSEVGAVAGQVDVAALCPSEIGVAIYVFPDRDTQPEDINIDQNQGPLVAAPVRFQEDEGNYCYRAAFLPAGDYTLALTCQADQDDPASDEDLEFVGQQNAVVEVGQTIPVHFPPE
ncbi:DUF4382 domain-containing protein [Desulfurivibrio sp. D14AmB]|uniref:DUF4382 domain-containing protein n=1 Tax=Desulfurivibrio sp. D14AmB TaxID=3374370 RepID=UPI00376F11DB